MARHDAPAVNKSNWLPRKLMRLLAVQFDDQLLVDGQVDVFALRQRDNAALVVVAVDLPASSAAV